MNVSFSHTSLAKIAINRELCSQLTSFNCYLVRTCIEYLHHYDSFFTHSVQFLPLTLRVVSPVKKQYWYLYLSSEINFSYIISHIIIFYL